MLSLRALRLLSQFKRATSQICFSSSTSSTATSRISTTAATTSSPIPSPPLPSPPTSSSSAFSFLFSRSAPLVSCMRVPDLVGPSRLFVETLSSDTVLAFRNLQRAEGVVASARRTLLQLTSVGQDTLLWVRSPVTRSHARRLAHALRPPRRRPAAMLARMNGTAGMVLSGGLTAMNHHHHRSFSDSDEDILSWFYYAYLSDFDKGPSRIGIGWIPPMFHQALANVAALALVVVLLWTFPHAHWWMTAAGVMFVTTVAVTAVRQRPELESFFQWTKDMAPDVARKKKMPLDKIKAWIAPWLIEWFHKPTLSNYGLFSIVSLVDNEDYMYIYAGVFSRWCLLGWYPNNKNVREQPRLTWNNRKTTEEGQDEGDKVRKESILKVLDAGLCAMKQRIGSVVAV